MAEDVKQDKVYSALYGIGQMLHLTSAGLQGNLTKALSQIQKDEEEKKQRTAKLAQERLKTISTVEGEIQDTGYKLENIRSEALQSLVNDGDISTYTNKARFANSMVNVVNNKASELSGQVGKQFDTSIVGGMLPTNIKEIDGNFYDLDSIGGKFDESKHIIKDGLIYQKQPLSEIIFDEDNKEVKKEQTAIPIAQPIASREKEEAEGSTTKATMINEISMLRNKENKTDKEARRLKTLEEAYIPNTTENLTQDERTAKNLRESKSFKDKYGNLSEQEQYIQSMKMANFKGYRQKVASDFFIDSYDKNYSEVKMSFSSLPKEEQAILARGQRESDEYKDFTKKVKGSVTAVKNLEERVDRIVSRIDNGTFQFGVIKDQWDTAIASIPDSWKDLSPESKRAEVAKITTNAEIQDLFFTYLNEVNKGAPSNADMEVMKQVVQGLGSGSNEVKKQSVINFMKNISSDTIAKYEDYVGSVYGASKKEYDKLETLKYKRDDKNKLSKKKSWRDY